jgi:hypothetical protein
MDRAPFVTRKPLGRLFCRALASTVVCIAAAVAHAAGDGLAISGTPPEAAGVGTGYSFTPTVADPLKRALSFTILNRPKWAIFNSSTGHLSGTPSAAYVGTTADIVIRVTDGLHTVALPEFYIRVWPSSSASLAISGTPPTSVIEGHSYSFKPSASGPSGKTLSFSVKNKPAWATFSISTGLLTGTPASSQTGTYADIVLSVSDGQTSSSLPAFNVTVTGSTSSTASAVIDWVPPTQNTNGTPLTDLAGVRTYYGTSASNLSHMVQISGDTQTSYTLGNLSAGTWYFGGVAYTTTGALSKMSSVVSLSVP